MKDTTYIDVREPSEFASGHLGGAINIPLGSIGNGNNELEKIAKDARVVVYCRSGGRAGQAKEQLQAMGYTNVENGINQEEISMTNHLA